MVIVEGFASDDRVTNNRQICVAKTFSVLLTGYLMYIMAFCPCKPQVYKCHLTQIYSAIAALVLIIMFFNGTHIRSYV